MEESPALPAVAEIAGPLTPEKIEPVATLGIGQAVVERSSIRSGSSRVGSTEPRATR
jgi:hypothetical protein